MVEYHEDQTDQDLQTEQAPQRRRRRSTYQPISAAGAAAPGDGEQPPPEEDVLPPEPIAAPHPEDADDDGAFDDADEQNELDVIVPATPESTEPANGDAPPPPATVRRPPLTVLFQAPPALPASVRSAPVAEPDTEDEDEEDDDDETQGGSRRRRRTRKRAGGGDQQAQQQPAVERTEVVQKPRREAITEPQRLKGSTRLEAKRQRRRDGRDAGRRRTVVTEAEFLARREAVDRVMLVRTAGDRVEIGVLEDGILAEHYVAKHQNVSLIGNVYLGRVQNVLPSMEAAFVDIGRGRNAVLYSGEVDWDAAGDRLGEKGSQARKIELALRSGDQVLVQVTKDPIGHKGARLTSAISLPGRYLVYVPNGSMSGISRKLPDTERARLKKILKDALPDSAGVIVRTAAEGATEEQLTVDVQRLANQWAEIEHLVEAAQAPAMLHGEPDLLVKIVRDVFNEDFAKLVVDGDQPRATIERYLQQVAPDLLDRLEPWQGDGDVFSAHRVTEQIEKALDRKVWLPSGGSLVIDRTEAMTVVDVNTGKFVGSGGNLEETVTKNNLEAAEEIVRQLRLRDIGGIIVIDFIDMVLESNRDLVSRRLVECLSRDRTKHQVAEVTSLGLVQMTRKRLGVGLAESVGEQPEAEKQDQGHAQRRRRGGGAGAAQTPVAPRPVTTHVITDGAKTALAQIAGATIVNGRVQEPGGRVTEPLIEVPVHAVAAAESGDQPTALPPLPEPDADRQGAPQSAAADPEEPLRREPRTGRRRRRASSPAQSTEAQPAAQQQPEPPAAPEQEQPPAAPEQEQRSREPEQDAAPEQPEQAAPEPPAAAQPAEQTAAPLLDLPQPHQDPRSRLPKRHAEDLLDSVLEALPAPKSPGQGRRRSRRVSTATLTAGED